MRKIKNSDLIFCILVSIVSVLPFLSANDTFSYDFQFYRMYFEEIARSDVSSLLDKTIGFYVFLQYSSGIEFGFVALTKVISLITIDPVAIYCFLVFISVILKVYSLKKLKVSNYLTALIIVYSLILLEGNALRSALSLSVMLFAYYILISGRFYYALLMCAVAFVFHVQSLIFLFFILLSRISVIVSLLRYKYFFYFALFFLFSSGFVINALFSSLVDVSGKINDYTGKAANAGGLNLLAVLSIVSLFCAIYYISKNYDNYSQNKNFKTSIMMFLASVFTLSLYVFFTSVAVVGDRLWQWGLVMMVVSFFNIRNNYFKIALNKSEVAMSMAVSFVIFNTTIRYPLTNLFYPILPFVDLSVGF